MPDFLIKDEGEFCLVYPNGEKAMAFAKSQKSVHWYSEKSFAIDSSNVRPVTAILTKNGFTVENC